MSHCHLGTQRDVFPRVCSQDPVSPLMGWEVDQVQKREKPGCTEGKNSSLKRSSQERNSLECGFRTAVTNLALPQNWLECF